MQIQFDDVKIYGSTAGLEFEPKRRTLVMIHGVLCDNSVWRDLMLMLDDTEMNMLAIDLPGQSHSTGRPPQSVEEAADAVVKVIETLGLKEVALAGHSFGSLIAMEAAARLPERVSHLIMLGTGFPMRVSRELLNDAEFFTQRAITTLAEWSKGVPTESRLADEDRYGWPDNFLPSLMERTQASAPGSNLIYIGLKACHTYENGFETMRKVKSKVMFIIGQMDRLTSPRSAEELAKHAKSPRMRYVSAGHAMLGEEAPRIAAEMREFLKPKPAFDLPN